MTEIDAAFWYCVGVFGVVLLVMCILAKALENVVDDGRPWK